MIKHRIIIQNFLLLVLMLIISLSVLEIIANQYLKANKLIEKLNNVERIISNKDSQSIGYFDKDLGWGFKPNSQGWRNTSDFHVEYFINSKGNRDKETSIEKPFAVFRVIALGESMVFGDGVNYGKRFTEVIEDSLANVEVVNMGVWGFGADQSLLQLKRDGFQFHPDAVVLFAINDFFERCKYVSRTGGVKPRFVLNPAKNGIILQDVQFVKKTFKIAPFHKKQSTKEVVKDKNNSLLAGSKLMLLLNYNKKMREINKRNKGFDKKYWRQVYKDLANDQKYIDAYNEEDFRKLVYFILQQYSVICKEQGVDFVLVHIDIGGKLRLKDICQELNITYLDLSQVLFCASKNRPLSFKINPHYNDSIHKIIGEYVSDYLKKKYNLQKAKDYVYGYLGKL